MATGTPTVTNLIRRSTHLLQNHRKNWCTRNPINSISLWNRSFSSCSSSSFTSMSNNNITTKAETGTNPTPPEPTSSKAVRVMIKGRVQGVFYRDWTVENARVLGLNGWVRNRRDGSVEALFSGNPDSVDEMEQKCRRGPPDARVTSLQVFPSNDDPGQGFHRKPTL